MTEVRFVQRRPMVNESVKDEFNPMTSWYTNGTCTVNSQTTGQLDKWTKPFTQYPVPPVHYPHATSPVDGELYDKEQMMQHAIDWKKMPKIYVNVCRHWPQWALHQRWPKIMKPRGIERARWAPSRLWQMAITRSKEHPLMQNSPRPLDDGVRYHNLAEIYVRG